MADKQAWLIGISGRPSSVSFLSTARPVMEINIRQLYHVEKKSRSFNRCSSIHGNQTTCDFIDFLSSWLSVIANNLNYYYYIDWFIRWCFTPYQQYFSHVTTLSSHSRTFHSLPMKGYNIWPILGTHGHRSVRAL